jgi:hypothetical protein
LVLQIQFNYNPLEVVTCISRPSWQHGVVLALGVGGDGLKSKQYNARINVSQNASSCRQSTTRPLVNARSGVEEIEEEAYEEDQEEGKE